MSLLVVIVALLLAGALGLLYFPWSGKGAVDRDALNRACTSRACRSWRRSAARTTRRWSSSFSARC
ncbi:cytochrome c heme lyase subunit CcmH [Klebsiella pneumoniae]|nr:cytochrome c heme lyase subunit CcmH [Klebsiella pneumoniae]